MSKKRKKVDNKINDELIEEYIEISKQVDITNKKLEDYCNIKIDNKDETKNKDYYIYVIEELLLSENNTLYNFK